MRQASLLAGAFLVTLTVLVGGFFGVRQLTADSSSAAATPAASPTWAATTPTPSTATAVPTPTVSPSPTLAPTPSATPTPEPSATPGPIASARASAATASGSAPASAKPSISGRSGTIQVTVLGKDYAHADVPANGTLTRGAGGSLTARLDRTTSDDLVLEYEVPASAIPTGFRIVSIDTRICGSGSGDFWETYGPAGSTPVEREVEQPAADGCWHYEGAAGPDTMVRADIRLASTLTITSVEYTLTLVR